MLRRLAQTVLERCDRLALCTEAAGQITRTFLCPPMREVHRQVRSWMEHAGMQVRLDAVGNLIGTYPAATPEAPKLLIGSHLDTVPDAGRYDGVLGVLLGIALVEALAGRRLRFALEVVGFSEEEGVRFGVPFLGSRAFAGSFEEKLLGITDIAGVSVAQAIRDFGLDPAEIAPAEGEYLGYLEFHIEQGPLLEAEGLPMGIVEAIVGQSRLELEFAGQAAHAGTTPMHLRRDALAGAARFVLEAEGLAREVPGLVATVGQLAVEPGAGNVIPGRARLSLDLRHARDAVRLEALERLGHAAQQIAHERGLGLAVATKLEQPAVPMDAWMQSQLAAAMEESGYPPYRLQSGAGHDAMILAQRMPSAMLFLRSPGGISHNPAEAVWPEDVAAALEVGARFLARLDSSLRG
ncbi:MULTISPECIES: allantoate amidohydrolase [unclassified Meiothermus]|uniref:allantoate amidohydrolase n=1 Tax=unclassified Meiothermus TaxID=370471 RepID=UPI000D7C6B86|nr:MULTISPECIES: allantoate amidohydrolase [unclassified Meiothermus]PZA08408.1 allantoate amidohydrolase [Meiothermus sp. Pnk-1]RYM37075.1 allantoate amidohydrolase [Meiothermus sp. PNK-Is4]